MRITLPYGREHVEFDLPPANLIGTIEPLSLPPLQNFRAKLVESFHHPTVGTPLQDILKTRFPKETVIIVNDLTRSTPTADILPDLLEQLKLHGIRKKMITIVVATGTHRPLSDQELVRVVGQEIKDQYRVVNHDCDAEDLVDLGPLSDGNVLKINRHVASAGIRLAIGEVLFHYYAGFAGGRKSILPGVAGRETTMRNHAMLMKPGATIGNLDGNPVHMQMLEGHQKCPLDFVINVVCDAENRVVQIVSGDPVAAWMEGVKTFKRMNTIPIPRQADVVLVSAGGFPKDISIFQAHKALEMASRAVKNNGSLILFAECREGLGHPVFAKWVGENQTPEAVMERLAREFTFGGHKLYFLARLATRACMGLYSTLTETLTHQVFCEKIPNSAGLLAKLQGRHGKDFQAYVIPQGGIVLPVIEGFLPR